MRCVLSIAAQRPRARCAIIVSDAPCIGGQGIRYLYPACRCPIAVRTYFPSPPARVRATAKRPMRTWPRPCIRPIQTPCGRKSAAVPGACGGGCGRLESSWARPRGGPYWIVAGCPGGVVHPLNKPPGRTKNPEDFENILPRLHRKKGARRAKAWSAERREDEGGAGRLNSTIKEIMTRLRTK